MHQDKKRLLNDQAESEADTFGIEQWKQKATELEKLVAEQTAELVAKNRELEIEAALEKIRSRSLTMHKSDELKDVVAVLFQQLKILGVGFDGGAGIHLFSEDSKDAVILVASPELTLPIQVNLPYDEEAFENNPIIVDVWKAKETGITIFNRFYSFEEKNKYFDYVFKYNNSEIIPQPVREFIRQADSYTASFIAEKNSLLGANSWSRQLFSESDFEVLKRIAKAFEQAYIRFFDLQKAEAQAREAQIQLALERVRARTMAMYHSSELAEVASLLFEQLTQLGASLWIAGFCLCQKDSQIIESWMSPPGGGMMDPLYVPYTVDEFYQGAYEAWKEDREIYIDYREGSELQKENEELLSQPFMQKARNFVIENGISTPVWVQRFAVIYKYGFLMIVTVKPFEETQIFIRFAQVFEQTYTRFLDLQKAEAQAREAQIEVALERVRTRTMSMHHSDELAEVMSVLCKGILNLGIHPDDMETCYITTLDDNKPVGEIYLTYSHGDLLPRSFQIRYDEDSLFKQIFTEWKNGTSFIIGHLEGTDLIQHFDYLFSHIPASIVEMRSSEPTQLPSETFTHALYFSQGYLAIVTRKAVPEYHEVFKRFGNTLQQAYTRFLDLKKAEAQAVQAHLDLIQIQTEKKRAEDALAELRITQNQLIQKEKLASLGELTAGIAHEIQNPLNFVNNFSETSIELLDEMKIELENGHADDAKDIANELIQNLQKINHHGKRADSIVKGMLLHSQSSSGQKEPTDINTLCDEYLRLSYNGLRAKDKSFNATVKTDFDKTIEKIPMIPQDIGRVVLNVLNNAFYAVQQKQKEGAKTGYEPTVTVSTKKMSDKVFIHIEDNGVGIPQKIRDKIFQPFFTTKPTGQGTGLGLSLSYDIVTKGHGGTLEVESKEGDGSEFTITLPV